MKKQDKIWELCEAVYMECSIECEECGDVAGEGGVDDIGAAETFYDLGWRIKKERVLCPKCRGK